MSSALVVLSTYLMSMLTISSVEPNSVEPDWAATT